MLRSHGVRLCAVHGAEAAYRLGAAPVLSGQLCLRAFGDVDQLSVATIPDPVPAEGEVVDDLDAPVPHIAAGALEHDLK